jgi:hypothetical protein
MRASAGRHQRTKLTARAGAITVTGRRALLVSNNAYGTSDIAGLGHRARLDTGALGVAAVTVNSAVGGVELLGGGGVTILAAGEVVVDADVPEIAVGIDCGAIMTCTPVCCTIQPRPLRVRVPEDRPGSARPRLPSTGRLCGSWPHSAPHRRAPDVRQGGCSLPRPGVSAALTPCELRRSPSLSMCRRSSACRVSESCPGVVWSGSAGPRHRVLIVVIQIRAQAARQVP